MKKRDTGEAHVDLTRSGVRGRQDETSKYNRKHKISGFREMLLVSTEAKNGCNCLKSHCFLGGNLQSSCEIIFRFPPGVLPQVNIPKVYLGI